MDTSIIRTDPARNSLEITLQPASSARKATLTINGRIIELQTASAYWFNPLSDKDIVFLVRYLLMQIKTK